MKNTKHKILKALFAEAKKLGISQEMLREDIAPVAINKRLSQATPQEIAFLLDHLKGNSKHETNWRLKRYESSRAGLIDEIRDLAIARFGADYALPLNAFCARFGEPDGFRKMRVNQMKMVKQRLKELQCRDTEHRVLTEQPTPNPSQEGIKSETQNMKQETQNSKVIIFQKGRKGFWNQLGEMDRPGE